MIEKEKLQKAVCRTIKSGYQLKRDAFEFLSEDSVEDPVILIRKVLEKLEEMDEKPLFIDKNFLEKVLNQPKKANRLTNQNSSEISDQQFELPENQNSKNDDKNFNPPAKNIESKIKF